MLKNKLNNNRVKKKLFNPYVNGFCSYDLAYLSSKRISKEKTVNVNERILTKEF